MDFYTFLDETDDEIRPPSPLPKKEKSCNVM